MRAFWLVAQQAILSNAPRPVQRVQADSGPAGSLQPVAVGLQGVSLAVDSQDRHRFAC